MMELREQIITFTTSILFGISFLFTWSIFNRAFYRSKYLRYPFEILFFLIQILIFFISIFKVNGGIFRLYYAGGAVLGMIIYYKLYANYMFIVIERIFKEMRTKIKIPILNKWQFIKLKIATKNRKKKTKKKIKLSATTSTDNELEWKI